MLTCSTICHKAVKNYSPQYK